MKILKKIGWLLLVVLIALQFFRPEKNVSEEIPETNLIVALNPPAEIATMLKTSCYDCHSNNTAYPWYSEVAPLSYWISDHVKDGKKHLDFSIWETYTAKKKAHKMEEFVEEVKEHKMPLESYLWIHKEAVLTPEQITQLVGWANQQRVSYQEVAKQEQADLP